MMRKLIGIDDSSDEETHRDWSYEDFIDAGIVTLAKPPLGIPTKVTPLRSILPAIGESSGLPSTSEPTNILTKNPASRVTEKSMREIKLKYRFPSSIEVRLASSSERIDYKVPGWIGFYERAFIDGFRFPIPKLVWEVLNHYQLAPSQLMPNTWRILLSIE